MNFIELTSAKSGRTIYVRVDHISVVSNYVNDDEGERHTKVWLGTLLEEDSDIRVKEPPEEVLRRIKGS
jgi:hypothetical protein